MAFGTLAREADSLLRAWVKEAGLAEGSRLPSERDLAKTLGVGHYAVNRAMVNLVTEGLVERRGYKLFLGGTKSPFEERAPFSCDLVVSGASVHRPGYAKIARELGISLQMHGWMSTEEAIAILLSLDNPKTECVLFDPPNNQSATIWEPAVAQLTRRGIPVVCVGQPAQGVFSVAPDSSRGLSLVFQHLWQLGHREMALATAAPRSPTALEVAGEWELQCKRRGLHHSTGRIFLPSSWQIMPEDAAPLAEKLTGEWSNVTALVVFTGTEFPVQHLLDNLSRRGKKIPRDISIAFVDDTATLSTANPGVTTGSIDIQLIQETAFRLAQRAVRKKAAGGIPPQFSSVRVQPQLTLRQSTAPLASRKSPAASTKDTRELSRSQITWVQFMDKNQDTDACLRKPYPEAMKAVESRFRPLDLSSHVNRPLNFRRGWLGDLPLRFFGPGRHWIHGIPFEVMGGPERTDCGAIVFHSAINSTGMGQKLPSRLQIPIGRKVAAIYILHGCGNAKHLQTFAAYSFHHKKQELGNIPLVSLGQPPPSLDTHHFAEACKKANIQDWWPDFPHLDFPGGRMVPIVDSDPKEQVQRHVYLYTLEWINPTPERIITHLEISADPKQSTTLGVLSICLLLTKEDPQEKSPVGKAVKVSKR